MLRTLPPALNQPRYVLENATLPASLLDSHIAAATEGLIPADLLIDSGRIVAILPPGSAPAALPRLDLDQGMVWPCFADIHTHLDKGHIWPRRPNPDGTFLGALNAVAKDRPVHWTAQDLRRRMDFSLRSAYCHGTSLIRTHLDAPAPQHRISFEVFAELREQWRARIALQAVALFPIEHMGDQSYFSELLAILRDTGALLGGVPQMSAALPDQLDQLLRAASAYGLDIDLHVDETDDPQAQTLRAIAEAVLRNRFQGRVTAGHCCSLARLDEDQARRSIDLVQQAGIAVISLPMCNLYLQDRCAGRTPRWRGVTLFKELAAAGVPCAVASDNSRDPFYAYGDLDPVEVFREAVRILHLDHPLDDAAPIITRRAAEIAGRPDLGRISPGQSADLVIFRARRWSEFLARPQSDRIVLRAGRVIDATLPDFRELDEIVGV